MEVFALKDVWQGLKFGKQFKGVKKSDKTLFWNLYAPMQKHSTYFVKAKAIRKFLKYWVIVPGIYLVRLLFGKHLEKTVFVAPYNVNLKIFEKAFDDAVEVWLREYVCREKSPGTAVNGKAYAKWRNGYAVECLDTMKKVVLSVALHDTAYRELLNVFVYELANGVIREYGDKKGIHHVFNGRSSPYDIGYYAASKIVQIDRNGGFEELLNRIKSSKKRMEEQKNANDTV